MERKYTYYYNLLFTVFDFSHQFVNAFPGNIHDQFAVDNCGVIFSTILNSQNN